MNTFLIDLDKTLYRPQTGIFDSINNNIRKYMSKKLNFKTSLIEETRSFYLKTYGSTLMGLIKNYKIEPLEFLDFVHNIDLSSISENPLIKEKLKNFEGKKIIFTSAPRKHAINILGKLDILDMLDDIFDIVEANFIAKPNKSPYLKIMEKFPSNSYIMIDDMEKNLLTAKSFNFKTIFVNKNKSPFVDLNVEYFEEIPIEFIK